MYKYFDYNAVKPTGWLRRQLEIQAEGLSGNLDKIWPDVRDSAWIGGNKEGWERVPYWLDGFIPLAMLLENDDMKARADKYINSIIAGQQEDGWICPCNPEERYNYDIWALFLIGKVLALYCKFTKSRKAEKALYKAMKCLRDLLFEDKVRLFNWGKFRWFECYIPLQYLYDKKPENWIIELAEKLRELGANYPDFIETWKRPLNKWTYHTHIVNLAMMIKYEAVCCRLFGEKYTGKADELWKILDKYNGTAVGSFTGDECLSGIGNNQGTELCAIVELMYSCELLYATTGKKIWADRLEKLAFNALPATISDDMWTHQYDQCVNQIACVKFPGKSFFRTNNSEAHLFGLEPNFGCCTSNFNQGWPKLALNVFLKARGGVLASLLLPSKLSVKIKGVPVTIENVSEYPFKNKCKFIVKTDAPVAFDFKIRIPSFAKNFAINDQYHTKTDIFTISKTFCGTEEFSLELFTEPRLVSRPGGLRTVEYGALVFALPIEYNTKMLEYERNGVERKFPYCDYELYPTSEWRYGFAGGIFEPESRNLDAIPFSSKNPPVVLKTDMCSVDWDYAEGYDTVPAAKPVSSAATSAPQLMTLVPYGCAKLRMTEMPLVKIQK
ncbi:MAG: glycoside hydrolase family 127 protein [Clostridia bacterium]|nr:glycoside hydrolase family 127 protein [Clostridia bacterium]